MVGSLRRSAASASSRDRVTAKTAASSAASSCAAMAGSICAWRSNAGSILMRSSFPAQCMPADTSRLPPKSDS
ncbi:Uncharacterised protein [Mycobacteroides abscessus subsp. abscessus]|nr:Uncharacterised protein [Mycobacteroides abscessus subsp. abscessus]